MFKASSICRSALSKRTNKVKVQVLKDFPMFQLFKGQVLQVKPSFMRNYLHNSNGARYILSDSDIDRTLLAQSADLESMRNKKSAPSNMKHKKEITVKESKAIDEAKEEKPSGILERDITVKNVKIPGLDL